MKLDQNLIYEDISVSVIMPIKNGVPFLEDSFNSLLRQTFQGTFEICIYDDGSTDTTSDYIRKFLPMFAAQGIHVLYKIGIESRGVGFAKNRAAEMGRGRFLCFCDADDVSMPDRIQKQYDRANALESNGGLVFLGSGFRRDPIKSTERYTRWANGLFKDDLRIQVHTSHGPTLIAPTWFISRMLYTILGGFEEKYQSGFPEDLEFFYRALNTRDVKFDKIDNELVIYRYHPSCATFGVEEESIWRLRMQYMRQTVLESWSHFTIWNAGKQGKRFFRSLTEAEKDRVVEFCDVDIKKIKRGCVEQYDEISRTITRRLRVVHVKTARPPFIICVKLDMTNGDLEQLIDEFGWVEGRDFVHFS